jgi:hypothetical protein
VKTGAEPKKLAILGVLVVVGGYVTYSNVFSGDSSGPAPPPRAAIPAPINVPPERATPLPDTRRTPKAADRATEIKFRQGAARPEDRPDPATIDPTLRLDLLAKVQNVEPEAAMRNVFQYGAAPPPPAAPIALPKDPPKIAIIKPPPAAPPPPPPPPGPPPPPKAPQMTFKYYGYKIPRPDGVKEAFLLDGDDIIIATENDSIKRGRYKIVTIGLTSITIEDTQFKSTQTIKLQEDAPA